jgi:hypothetical protein
VVTSDDLRRFAESRFCFCGKKGTRRTRRGVFCERHMDQAKRHTEEEDRSIRALSAVNSIQRAKLAKTQVGRSSAYRQGTYRPTLFDPKKLWQHS